MGSFPETQIRGRLRSELQKVPLFYTFYNRHPFYTLTFVDKSFGIFLHFWSVFNSHRLATPTLAPQAKLDACNLVPRAFFKGKALGTRLGRVYPVFFPSPNFVEGRGRENCKKISK